MPLPVETLRSDSSDEEIRQKISQSIAQCMKEPNDRSQEQCAAIAYRYAREKTGKSLDYGR